MLSADYSQKAESLLVSSMKKVSPQKVAQAILNILKDDDISKLIQLYQTACHTIAVCDSELYMINDFGVCDLVQYLKFFQKTAAGKIGKKMDDENINLTQFGAFGIKLDMSKQQDTKSEKKYVSRFELEYFTRLTLELRLKIGDDRIMQLKKEMENNNEEKEMYEENELYDVDDLNFLVKSWDEENKLDKIVAKEFQVNDLGFVKNHTSNLLFMERLKKAFLFKQKLSDNIVTEFLTFFNQMMVVAYELYRDLDMEQRMQGKEMIDIRISKEDDTKIEYLLFSLECSLKMYLTLASFIMTPEKDDKSVIAIVQVKTKQLKEKVINICQIIGSITCN